MAWLVSLRSHGELLVQPSEAYRRCLEEAKVHHASSKTYSGKFLRPHAPFIKEIIGRLCCTSVLDYGCGKGSQYEWVSHGDDASIPQGLTLEKYWNVPVTKYDPAWPPFSTPPNGVYDLVICTHVLGSIPIADLNWVLEQLFSLASKAVYIAEKIGPVSKQVFSSPESMPRWAAPQWREWIGKYPHPGIECVLATREKTDRGVIVERVRL